MAQAEPTPHESAFDELVAIGMDLARRIQAADADDLPLDQATIAFERVARAVRRTILLARTPVPAAAGSPVDPAEHRIAARRRILRKVGDDISTEATGPAAERLTAELHERLDSPETEQDIATRPIHDIIAEICQDLGIAGIKGFPDPWKRRTPAEAAALHARAARPPLPSGEGRGEGSTPPPNPPRNNPASAKSPFPSG